jgi:hypothetical protein
MLTMKCQNSQRKLSLMNLAPTADWLCTVVTHCAYWEYWVYLRILWIESEVLWLRQLVPSSTKERKKYALQYVLVLISIIIINTDSLSVSIIAQKVAHTLQKHLKHKLQSSSFMFISILSDVYSPSHTSLWFPYWFRSTDAS